MVKIGVVLPTFTAAAYNFVHPNYYDWYNEYYSENTNPSGVTADLTDLTAVVPTTHAQLTNPNILYVPEAQKLCNHLLATRPSDTITTLTDIDIHNGAQANYDILLIFHEEYVTSEAYNNFQSFVTQGGVLVAMDGNVFFARVSYNPSAQTITLVSGHYWQQVTNANGEKVAKAGPGEYWKSSTREWFGSNSDAAPDISDYAYLGTTLGYNPFAYPVHPNTSGVENQYRSNPRDVVLVDYEASVSPSTHYLGPISTYYLDSGKGRSLVFGLFTDVIQSNPVFLSFFDQIFQDYGVNRSTAPYTGNPGPSVPATISPPPKDDSVLKLENKVRRNMGLPQVSGR
jgi:hypothetical protein